MDQDKVPPDLKPKPPEPLQINPFRPEDTSIAYEKPFLPKPVPHSPKISPSSIPNPNPSVTTNKPIDTGYPNYGGYLYSVPGFSAFQPVSYPGIVQPNPAPIHSENTREYIPFSSVASKESITEKNVKEDVNEKSQTDFEEHFTPEIIPAVSIVEVNETESKMSVTSQTKSSEITVTVPPSSLPLLAQPSVTIPISSMTNLPSRTTMNTLSQDIKNIVSTTIISTSEQNVSTKPLPISHIPSHKIESVSLETLANMSPLNEINQSSSNIRSITSHNTGQIPSQIPVTSSAPSLINMMPTKTVTPPALPQTIGTIQSQLLTTLSTQSTVTIPPQPTVTTLSNCVQETKKKSERFSLKTSIPISKIDMKCVNSSDLVFQSPLPKKPNNPNTSFPKTDASAKIEIQSNVVIKSALKEPEPKSDPKPVTIPTNSISALLNAAEVIHKNEAQFRIPEPRQEIRETKDHYHAQNRFSSTNIDKKLTFPNKSQDPYNEQKNKILFIQNKPANPKMLLAIQQQNPQVLLQRTNFDPKNLQAPSRLSNQSRKVKEDDINDNALSKVVALKRLHQDNYDENDFENLITENQIYGNKIVVKEKSQGTLQEQDLRKNKAIEKQQNEAKNVVLHSNFLYLGNVQFPANLMMIKNNMKLNQSNDTNLIKVTANENKLNNETNIIQTQSNGTDLNNKKQNKTHNISTKEIHVLKNNNNVLQTTSNKNNKSDIVIQANQKVIMNPQILYQMPTIESDNKTNHTFLNRQYSSNVQIKDVTKPFDHTKNDKLYIACPYQMDAKLQPKIVITNIRSKLLKAEEISSLDIYEKKKELKRFKYLSKLTKESQRTDKKHDKNDITRNIITPRNMKAEIFEEFLQNNMRRDEEANGSESDYDGDDLKNYEAIIKEFGASKADDEGKVNFLANLNLATQDTFKEKEMDRQERIFKVDSVATACIKVGRLDKLTHSEADAPSPSIETFQITKETEPLNHTQESGKSLRRKQMFLLKMNLMQVSTQYKEEYEKSWQKILIDRKRRYGTLDTGAKVKMAKRILEIDPNSQLQLLTEIKKCVNENNNLIKKRFDSVCGDNIEDSIRILAEKNFTELNRLSKMAVRSVKLFSGQDMKKRDLNPGFDSENIQIHLGTLERPYHSINIPNISKIIALKSVQESQTVTTTQATSMDEPQNSAAGVKEMFESVSAMKDRSHDVGCQTDGAWPGINVIMKMYKDHEAARKREIAELQRRNTGLRVEGVHITRAAACESDKAQVLLAERQHLAIEENRLRTSIERLWAAIEVIKNS